MEAARKPAQASEREERALQKLKEQRAPFRELVKASRSERRAAESARRVLRRTLEGFQTEPKVDI